LVLGRGTPSNNSTAQQQKGRIQQINVSKGGLFTTESWDATATTSQNPETLD
jgi:hypothetical protein